MLIASTTKILTALVVLENCGVGDKVLIGDNFPAVEGSSIYLKHGEELTVQELLYGLLLASGNDAAVALALHVSGSVEEFCVLMNARAHKLGCKNSNFVNPNGLDAANHYACARDLALIAREAMKNKTFSDIVSAKHWNGGGRYYKNHNRLLWTCPGALGIKTGFTESAGRSLVSCVEREGMRLICVTISAPSDWNDHTSLYNWAYSEFRCIKINRDEKSYGSVPIVSGVTEMASVQPAEDYAGIFSKQDTLEVTWEIPKFMYAPVGAGEKAGVISIKKNGEPVKEIPLVYSASVTLDKSVPLSRWEKLKRSLTSGGRQTFVQYGYKIQ